MYTIDETEEMLNEVAEEMPQVFYKELHGGIVLREDVHMHPLSKNGDLFILGEYHHSYLGNYIAIYYGSFIRTYGHYSKEAYKEELRKTLKHEFRHHLERLAGSVDLEIEDAIRIQNYMKK